jgi:hypothetical protein
VFFYYEATFVETAPDAIPADDHDLMVSCNLYSNIDHYASPGYPATVSNNLVTPGTSSTDCLLFKHVYRIVFDDGGFVGSDARSEWVSIKNDHDKDLYAPINLSPVMTPNSTPNTGWAPFSRGNPALGLEFLSYVKVNARYK